MRRRKEPTAKQILARTGSMSEPQQGPIVTFTDDELEYIAALQEKAASWDLYQHSGLGPQILEKIRSAQARSPRFKEPLE